MMRSGLVSITFRQLEALEVLRLAAEAGLEAMEWGGDIHVPPGEIATARRVGAATRDAGLEVAAYGSYYRLGVGEPAAFDAVRDSAVALGAPLVRVWCGNLASAQAGEADRQRVVGDALRISELARAAGLTIACEWHGGTLTDEAGSARRLFDAVDHPAFMAYWQPHPYMAFEDCLRDMEAALPRLVGMHVYEWDVRTRERRPLRDGADKWPCYLRKVMTSGASQMDRDLYAMLEFVKDDDPARLREEAAVLREWIGAVNRGT